MATSWRRITSAFLLWLSTRISPYLTFHCLVSWSFGLILEHIACEKYGICMLRGTVMDNSNMGAIETALMNVGGFIRLFICLDMKQLTSEGILLGIGSGMFK